MNRLRLLFTTTLLITSLSVLEACDKGLNEEVKDKTEQESENQNPDDSQDPEQTPDPEPTPEPEPEPTPEPEPYDPMADGKLCILAIGNSFSQDAVEQYLWNLFDAEDIEVVIGNMYIGGCTLETHWKLAQSGEGKYYYRKVVDGTKTEQPSYALPDVFSDEAWDIVTFQQASGKSGEYDTYKPYLANLIGYAQDKAENAAIWFHQTWAYSQNSDHGEFPKYDKNQMTMYNAIMQSVQQAFSDNTNLVGVIPSGTAIQNGRTSYLGDTFNRDGYHLETTHGRYTAACTWFEALSGKSVVGNTYSPVTIDKATAEIAQNAAHAAVTTPYSVTTLTDYLTPPKVEGPLTSDVSIDFGKNSSSSPWNTVNDLSQKEFMLKNANNDYTPLLLTINPAFSKGFEGVGTEPDNEIMSGDISWPKSAWADSFLISGTAGQGDSETAVITISGFTPSQSLDVTILTTRYNGTRTARTTEFILTGSRSETAQLQQGIRIGSSAGEYATWENVPFEEYTFSVKGITADTDGKLTLSVKGIDVGSTVVEGHISAMHISPTE